MSRIAKPRFARRATCRSTGWETGASGERLDLEGLLARPVVPFVHNHKVIVSIIDWQQWVESCH